jgi:drug/metabolite transporter (DMT)-like permease
MPADMLDMTSLAERIFRYRIFLAVALFLMWLSMGCVKLCFLAFFKKLIRQMPSMSRFWWMTLVFNLAVIVYGSTIYFVACPLLGPDKGLQMDSE